MKQSFTINFDDTKIIRYFEGHSLKAYPDPITKDKPWTISYGLTGDWVKKGLILTQEESDKKFMEYINKLCNDIDKLIKVKLNKNQYIAILSFSYNLGLGSLKQSTLLRYVNENRFKDASGEFRKWINVNGKPIEGLKNRRNKEKELFETQTT